MAKKKGMTATEAADKLTKAFKLSPPLPARWSAIFRAAEELGHSARVMINADEGALVQSERLGFSNGGGMFDPAKKYPEIDSLEKAEEFLNTEEGKGVTGYGNILSLDDLSNAFATGGDAPGNPYIREAYRKATVGVGGGKDDEEARSKYQAAYKRAIAKGNEGAAGYGDYIRGRGDVRADYF